MIDIVLILLVSFYHTGQVHITCNNDSSLKIPSSNLLGLIANGLSLDVYLLGYVPSIVNSLLAHD